MRTLELASACVSLLRSGCTENVLGTPCNELRIIFTEQRAATLQNPSNSVILKPVPKDLSDAEISTALLAQNPILSEHNAVIELFTKNDQSTGAVKITFSDPSVVSSVISLGHLRVGNLRCPVHKFSGSQKKKSIIRCYKCHKFGHISAICRSVSVTCGSCGFKSADRSSHEWNNCENEKHCANCSDSHPTWSRECTYFKSKYFPKNKKSGPSQQKPTSATAYSDHQDVSVHRHVGTSVSAPSAPRDVLNSAQTRKQRRNRNNQRKRNHQRLNTSTSEPSSVSGVHRVVFFFFFNFQFYSCV
jgi:hypothetical protein